MHKYKYRTVNSRLVLGRALSCKTLVWKRGSQFWECRYGFRIATLNVGTTKVVKRLRLSSIERLISVVSRKCGVGVVQPACYVGRIQSISFSGLAMTRVMAVLVSFWQRHGWRMSWTFSASLIGSALLRSILVVVLSPSCWYMPHK